MKRAPPIQPRGHPEEIEGPLGWRSARIRSFDETMNTDRADVVRVAIAIDDGIGRQRVHHLLLVAGGGSRAEDVVGREFARVEIE